MHHRNSLSTLDCVLRRVWDIRAPPELVGDDPFRGPFGLGVGADMRIAADPVKEECVVARLHAQDETDVVVAEVFDGGTIGG